MYKRQDQNIGRDEGMCIHIGDDPAFIEHDDAIEKAMQDIFQAMFNNDDGFPDVYKRQIFAFLHKRVVKSAFIDKNGDADGGDENQ